MMVPNEQCSVAIMQDILTKKRDPKSLNIPCEFGNSTKMNAIAGSGASWWVWGILRQQLGIAEATIFDPQ